MKVLVINSGNSSIKHRLFDMANGAELATGDVELIGEPEGLHAHRVLGSDGGPINLLCTVSARRVQ